MRKFKGFIYNTLIALLIVMPILLVAHYFLFPQESKCILINYSDFKKDSNLYYDTATPPKTIDTLKAVIATASLRVTNFWGQTISDPKIIYCVTDSEFKEYGDERLDPATTHYKMGRYIVINNDGIDVDIIAHEMSHAEFEKRIGFYNETFKIPTWFDEGMAMQNDYRPNYSEEALKAVSNDFEDLPNVDTLKTASQFWGGSQKQIRLNYMTAKYVVKNWYSKEKLDDLVNGLNSGKSFEEAYGQ